MQAFYFHVRDGDTLFVDPDGSDLPDLEAARARALAAARAAVSQALRAGRVLEGRRFEIADEAGRVLARVGVQDVLKPH